MNWNFQKVRSTAVDTLLNEFLVKNLLTSSTDLCLQLFAHFNLLSNEVEASFFENKISNEFRNLEIDIIVPNSKIMNVINSSNFFLFFSFKFYTCYFKTKLYLCICKGTITEFRLLNEKSRIFKIYDSIKKLYSQEKYNDVIESLETYIDTFKLVIRIFR
jgi:hypothetical protein